MIKWETVKYDRKHQHHTLREVKISQKSGENIALNNQEINVTDQRVGEARNNRRTKGVRKKGQRAMEILLKKTSIRGCLSLKIEMRLF